MTTDIYTETPVSPSPRAARFSPRDNTRVHSSHTPLARSTPVSRRHGSLRTLANCAATLGLLLTGCVDLFGPQADAINPFRDLTPVVGDGQARDVTTDILALGSFETGEVVRVHVRGERVEAVLILLADETSGASGFMVGGGPANEAFDYRIPESGRYFAYIQIDPAAAARQRRATIAVEPGDADFAPPVAQRVLVVFEDGFLSRPGLTDSLVQLSPDAPFLESIADQVRGGIVDRLLSLFDGTPVVLSFDAENPPDAPFSTLRFSPDRVLADDTTLLDSALPPTDPTRPECSVRVVFGEVLPRGKRLDPGNRQLDDEAVVYVGSFQGRGPTCQSAVINSVNNIVLGLSQTGAHEIGHLIGLYHVQLTDIMDRSPTLAFQRELTFQRGQVLIDSTSGGEVTTTVLTTVTQDPTRYFASVFASDAP